PGGCERRLCRLFQPLAQAGEDDCCRRRLGPPRSDRRDGGGRPGGRYAEGSRAMTLSRRQIAFGLTGAALVAGLRTRSAAQAVRWFESSTSPLGMALSEEQQAAGARFLRRHATVDVHSHPGRFFLRGIARPTPSLQAYGAPFDDKAVADMRAGHVSAALFSGVADM